MSHFDHAPGYRPGRPQKGRVRVCVMIDSRLWQRVLERSSRAGTRSDALNDLLWAGVIGRANLAEKYEFEAKWDKLSEMLKSWIDNNL